MSKWDTWRSNQERSLVKNIKDPTLGGIEKLKMMNNFELTLFMPYE